MKCFNSGFFPFSTKWPKRSKSWYIPQFKRKESQIFPGNNLCARLVDTMTHAFPWKRNKIRFDYFFAIYLQSYHFSRICNYKLFTKTVKQNTNFGLGCGIPGSFYEMMNEFDVHINLMIEEYESAFYFARLNTVGRAFFLLRNFLLTISYCSDSRFRILCTNLQRKLFWQNLVQKASVY